MQPHLLARTIARLWVIRVIRPKVLQGKGIEAIKKLFSMI
jgi:hypothetical protein